MAALCEVGTRSEIRVCFLAKIAQIGLRLEKMMIDETCFESLSHKHMLFKTFKKRLKPNGWSSRVPGFEHPHSGK